MSMPVAVHAALDAAARDCFVLRAVTAFSTASISIRLWSTYTAGSDRSRPNNVLNVNRFDGKKQNELISRHVHRIDILAENPVALAAISTPRNVAIALRFTPGSTRRWRGRAFSGSAATSG